MPALNFQPQWANAVQLGALQHAGENVSATELTLPKRTTIRRPGRIKPGNTLYLYTGQRTKECRKLGEVLCLSVTPVFASSAGQPHILRLGGQWLDSTQTERLARLDTAGLWGTEEIFAFIEKAYGLPFHGELIGW